MARNTRIWLRRLKKKFPTSRLAWEDIESTTDYTKRSVRANHTKYYWRWQLMRVKKQQ